MLTFRHVREDELDAFWDALSIPFSFDRDRDDEAHLYEIFEKDRLISAFDGDTLVGTFGGFTFDMTVPGAGLPTVGTTIVTVLPTHRRQGALTGMMHAHFDEAIERGEPLAALWASEAPIYGRFGYGSAAEEISISIDSRHMALHRVPDDVRIRFVDKDEALRIFPPLYEQRLRERPGHFVRSDKWWESRRLRDPQRHRGGATAHRLAVAERAGGAVGYIHFRTKEDWSSGFGAGEVRIIELIGIDLDAELALWDFAAGIDLMEKVTADHRPPDDPLLWNFVDPRRMNRKVSDSLWVRVLDVETALGSRRYSADGTITLEIADPFRPELGGTFTLTVENGVGVCRRSNGAADLAMDARYLGALYLGGRDVPALAAAGAVDGEADTLLHADQMFRWHPAPWCPEIF